jgi:hypothetical protein
MVLRMSLRGKAIALVGVGDDHRRAAVANLLKRSAHSLEVVPSPPRLRIARVSVPSSNSEINRLIGVRGTAGRGGSAAAADDSR